MAGFWSSLPLKELSKPTVHYGTLPLPDHLGSCAVSLLRGPWWKPTFAWPFNMLITTFTTIISSQIAKCVYFCLTGQKSVHHFSSHLLTKQISRQKMFYTLEENGCCFSAKPHLFQLIFVPLALLCFALAQLGQLFLGKDVAVSPDPLLKHVETIGSLGSDSGVFGTCRTLQTCKWNTTCPSMYRYSCASTSVSISKGTLKLMSDQLSMFSTQYFRFHGGSVPKKNLLKPATLFLFLCLQIFLLLSRNGLSHMPYFKMDPPNPAGWQEWLLTLAMAEDQTDQTWDLTVPKTSCRATMGRPVGVVDPKTLASPPFVGRRPNFHNLDLGRRSARKPSKKMNQNQNGPKVQPQLCQKKDQICKTTNFCLPTFCHLFCWFCHIFAIGSVVCRCWKAATGLALGFQLLTAGSELITMGGLQILKNDRKAVGINGSMMDPWISKIIVKIQYQLASV